MSSSGPPMAKPKGLLDSIEGFKKGGLKKTKTVDKSAPAIVKESSGGGGGGSGSSGGGSRPGAGNPMLALLQGVKLKSSR